MDMRKGATRMRIRMVRSLCLSGLLLFVFLMIGRTNRLNLAAATSPQDATSQAAIRAILQSQQEAWNRADIEKFMAGYWKSERTEFVGSDGIIRGWQAVLDRYKKSYPNKAAMGRLTFSDLEITMLSSDSAYILGKWHLEREKDHPGGVFTLIARKFPQGWRIIHDHTSAFATQPAGGQ